MTPSDSASGPERGARGHLPRNMVLFARLLRVGELDVTPPQMGDWLDAIGAIDLRRRADFKNATRSVLVRRREDLEWFELAFELFWQARDPRELQRMELGILQRPEQRKSSQLRIEQAAEPPPDESRNDEPERLAAWSNREVLRERSFAALSAEERREVKRLIAGMRFELETRRTRRRVRARGGREIDLRATLRKNLRSGGELLHLPRRRRKLRRRPLIVLCDVSGSMEPYSRILLHFLYAISRSRSEESGRPRLEAFAFGTRLTRITPYLMRRDVDDALRQATEHIHDWGGGTRTGEALRRFNVDWSRRVLGQGPVVLIISDGWDRGDIDLLSREIDRLHRSCSRLIWLNPLLGSPEYEPLTRGMQAALPHLDDFLPVHNLRSLEQLGRLLERL